ncbi:hypothetical protein XFF6992_390086 [Xanthomonas citri pv. fuscans]|uniref:Uncharacterized protein n=1 Tax=Xanthomonas campestris pv. phaseoli TaxID=317013 RepID=A0A7Z7IY85_XANCH|nr:hypothetical protein XFF6990_340042 [Xanthomonas citri pv. fuscans]SOO20013.1 hypothetical protein XFF6992_390086 [Xanthomonas citri pv. fuscans]SOO22705.1 hypothetical protein XFF6991_150469 [Xanthomonas phaseoli pv. phaseoli]
MATHVRRTLPMPETCVRRHWLKMLTDIATADAQAHSRYRVTGFQPRLSQRGAGACTTAVSINALFRAR